ncbi:MULTISPECIES: hypothetical protein [Bacillus cereus group]|uniref:Ricin B lectin domain-containing protein n=3 Tax=Bacillus cereus group TaxID=86661 RepID=A0ABC9SRD2_BACCE|nr:MULTISPECIES: hypothetical protein [Bacillus cereus group]EJP85560.1 hypothetical protein IC1_04598 [Bacillus cereus VD022]EOQ58125.1 hypothetical protein IAY_04130 [Bacillus cereus TIAC219]MCU5086788.1 hypothetical protein [Bacillus cereus]PRT25967.1 hypothetical protein C6351_24705 [Bacillus thuringiensis]TKH75685.1 hypothetical protein FC686_19580 [Bacillus cereus]
MYNPYNLNYSSHNLYNNYRADSTINLMNFGHGNFKDVFLDINDNNGTVILSNYPNIGVNWRLTDNGQGIIYLQNFSQNKFKNWFLDINTNNGNIILSNCISDTIYWKINRYPFGRIRLQNLGEHRFKNWFLSIDRNNGVAILSPHEGNQTDWQETPSF